MPGTVYIAGPMTGRKHYNFPAFDRMANHYRAAGWIAINPADLDRVFFGWGELPPSEVLITQKLKAEIIMRDLAAIATLQPETDAIVLLEGWQDSEGAQAEVSLARFLGLPIHQQINDEVLRGPE